MRKNVIKMLICAFLLMLIMVEYGYAVNNEQEMTEMLEDKIGIDEKVTKKAYLTFDDGPSIYTEGLLEVLGEYNVPGIFFVLGKQFEYFPNTDEILLKILDEGHHIALHTMTHDKHALYWSEKAPSTFAEEMLELKEELKLRTGHSTNLCRAPYGKSGHFKLTHFKAIEDAGLYCIDWHIDSKDWAKLNAVEIYNEVKNQLKGYKDQSEIVLLFHEYERTIEVLPKVIELLVEYGFEFEPYVEGKKFEGL